MALFGAKNNKKAVSKEVKKETSVSTNASAKKTSSSDVDFSVIRNPRITEKATFVSEKNNVYTFDVSTTANEKEIKMAVKNIYNVSPLKVNIVNVKGKSVFQRGKLGKRPDSKKAYVYLKEGDKIEFA